LPIPFIVPSRSFPSRTAAKNAIRDEILHAYPLRTRIDNEPHHQLLSEVLELHSDATEKIGSGIDHFYVEETWRLPGREAVSRKQRAIIVARTDGTHEDWSYRHVIDEPTVMANVKSALAFSIEEGRLRRRDADFGAGTTITCFLTGEAIDQKHQADTRHFSPTWHQITSDFVDQNRGWAAIETHSGHGKIFVGRDIEDVSLKEAWLAYYDSNAHPVYVKNERPAHT
jgi:hypothetical protein